MEFEFEEKENYNLYGLVLKAFMGFGIMAAVFVSVMFCRIVYRFGSQACMSSDNKVLIKNAEAPSGSEEIVSPDAIICMANYVENSQEPIVDIHTPNTKGIELEDSVNSKFLNAVNHVNSQSTANLMVLPSSFMDN